MSLGEKKRVQAGGKKYQRRNKKRWGRQGPKYWLFLSAFTASAIAGSKAAAPVYAMQTRTSPSDAQSDSDSGPVQRFDIPAGTLDEVLPAFEKASGTRVVLIEELQSLPSSGVYGLYTAEQALRKILAGSGTTYRYTGAETVALELEKVSTSIDVTASAPEIAASPKYSQALLDTPQTINTVSREVMEAQGNTTLRDALRNVAGISLAAGEGGSQGDNLTIRGFSARNDLYIDGMRDFGSYYRDPFNTEEVQVLQGPASVMFGRGSTGGVVNQAAKAPQLTRILSADVEVGTDQTRRLTIDINQPVPQFGSGAAFGLNLMGDEGGVAGRPVAENRRFGAAPSLSFGLGTDTRLTFSYFHQTGDDIPDYGIPWLFNGPAPVSRHNYYGFQNGNFLRTYDDIGTFRAEHDVNSRVTIRNQVRYANYARAVRITEPQIPAGVTPATPLSDIQVNRNELTSNSTETFLDDQLDLTARFKTGFLDHALVTGVEAGRETSDPTRRTWAGVPTTSLLNPDPSQPFAGTPTISSNVHTTALSQAAYVLDTVKLGNRWNVTEGLRWDRFDADYSQSVAPAAAFHRVDEMPTWRAALVYKPVPAGSIYFSAGTSFNPSAESLALAANTANLPPEKNRTFEFGSKWDLPGRKLTVQGAVFRTEKLNAREPDPNNALLNVLAGTQRVDGIQVEAKGHLTSRWEILSSYSYLDGKVVSSNFYPAAIGAQLVNVPKNTFNLWTEYYLPWHWEAGFGGNYVASRTASSTVPFDPVTGLVKEVPGYWVFNAMAKHPLGEHADLQINLNNLTDKYYYDGLHPAHLVIGAGRAAFAELKLKF